MIPQCISHYNILSKLGEGGMGEYWFPERNEDYNSYFYRKILKEYDEFIVSLSFASKEMNLIAQCHSKYNNVTISNDGNDKIISIEIPNISLNPGEYYLNIIVFNAENNRQLCWHYAERIITVSGEFIGGAPVQYIGKWRLTNQIN